MNKCFRCSNPATSKDFCFTCLHSLCSNCLNQNMSIDDIIDLNNFDYISFSCPSCFNGSLKMSIHNYAKLSFKKDSTVKTNIATKGSLYSSLKLIETKFRDKLQIEMSNHINQINSLLSLIEQMKSNYLSHMSQLMHKGIWLFKILEAAYSNSSDEGTSTMKPQPKDNGIYFSFQKTNIASEYQSIKEHLLLYQNANLIKITFDLGHNRLRQTNTLLGHLDSIYAIEKLDDKLIASGSNDKVIRIWDIKNSNCIHELISHCNSVLALKLLPNGALASGSGDKTIKLWNLSEFQCANTMIGHNSEVYSLAILRNGSLASGSGDKTIKIWNLTTLTCARTLQGHGRSIFSLCLLSSGLLCSGSFDCLICLWNCGNEANDRCCQKLIGHSNAVNCLIELFDKRIASGSSDSTVKIWNSKSYECELTIAKRNNERILSMIQLSDSKVIFCSNANLNLYDIEMGLLLSSFSSHTHDVYSIIKFDSHCVISGSGDKDIIIWNI